MLAGTSLRYGDRVGFDPVNIAAFEVDGVDYEFHKCLPYPTGNDGASINLDIIAMCLAIFGEQDVSRGRESIGRPLRECKST